MSEVILTINSYCDYSELYYGTATNKEGDFLEEISALDHNRGTAVLTYEMPTDLEIFWKDFRNPKYNKDNPLIINFHQVEFDLEFHEKTEILEKGLRNFEKTSFDPESITLDKSVEGEFEAIQIRSSQKVIFTAIWEPKFENKKRIDRWIIKSGTHEEKLSDREELEKRIQLVLNSIIH